MDYDTGRNQGETYLERPSIRHCLYGGPSCRPADGDGEVDYGTIEAMAPKDVNPYIFLTHAVTYAAHPNYPGYTFFNPETMQPMVNDPAYQRALEEYKRILKLGPPNMINYGGGDERAAFPAGESALAIDWHDTALATQNPDSSKVKELIGYAL